MSKADVAAERKDQIVKATVDCITKYGYHNFSMQDVANAAGVSKGIIHYYFLNKEELMMCVLDKVAGNIEKLIADDLLSSDDPKRKLQIFVQVAFQVVSKTKEYYQVNMDFWTQINQNEEIRKAISRHYDKFRKTASRIISEGIEKKKFKTVNPEWYSSYIIASIDGLSLQHLFDDEAFDYDSISKNCFDWIMAGLTVKGS